MKINLKDKKLLIAGIQGSGKTHLARVLSQPFKTAVYTPNPADWEYEKVLLFKPTDYVADFPVFCRSVKRFAQAGKVNMFVVDDSDVIFQHHLDTSQAVRDVVANHRHYGLGIMMISHRPQDVPARLYGQFETIACFSIESPHVVDLLNRYYLDFGTMVSQIPYGSHVFALKEMGKAPKLMSV